MDDIEGMSAGGINIVGKRFHLAMDFSLRSMKRFHPGGPKMPISTFQVLLKRVKGKIYVSADVLSRYELGKITYLGKDLFLENKDLASYLYAHAIHPVFFAEALHVIASRSTALSLLHKCVNLHRLSRDSVSRALKEGKIAAADTGTNYALFADKSVDQKLHFLLNLGVLIPKDAA